MAALPYEHTSYGQMVKKRYDCNHHVQSIVYLYKAIEYRFYHIKSEA
jgi:hypothetical protein